MRPPRTFLLTDTHFNDKAMLAYRPAGYERLIIKNCRRCMAPQDTLIHLGDVIFSRPGELKDYLSRIPAKNKILVRGNHDKSPDSWYMGQGFNLVADALVMGDIYLSHQPLLTGLPQGCRINVHGHFHNFGYRTEAERLLHNEDVHKLYALESTDYEPVELRDDILAARLG